MSLYGDAIAALRSMVLLEERIQGVTKKVDRLGDEVRDINGRLIRVETIIDIVRPDGDVLRLTPRDERDQR